MRVQGKPHIYWKPLYNEWWCSSGHVPPPNPDCLGCGLTPQAAYTNWQDKQEAHHVGSH